jgi:hypothetical protein
MVGPVVALNQSRMQGDLYGQSTFCGLNIVIVGDFFQLPLVALIVSLCQLGIAGPCSLPCICDYY